MLYSPFETRYGKRQEEEIPVSSFRPNINKPLTAKYVTEYMKEPERFSISQARKLAQHAQYYGIPFRFVTQDEAEFDLFRALRYMGEGWIQGFSTLRIGDEPVNVWERVAKSIGSTAGYAGFLPGVGPLAGVAKAVAGKSVPLLVSKAVLNKVAPQVAGMVERVALGAATGKASAVATAAKFLMRDVPRNIAYGMGSLGVAGAVSQWQDGIDSMMRGFVGGSYMEMGDRLIAEAMKMMIGGATGGASAQAISRTLAGAMWNGLPSTIRKDTTPEQVFQYAIGALFAYRDLPAAERYGREFYAKSTEEAKKRGPYDPTKVEDLPGWDKISDNVKEVAARIFRHNVGTANERNNMTKLVIDNLGIKPEDLVDPESLRKVRDLSDELFAKVHNLTAEELTVKTELDDTIKEEAKLKETQIVVTETAKQNMDKYEIDIGGTKVIIGDIEPSDRSAKGNAKILARRVGDNILLNPSVVIDKFVNKTWTTPAVYSDGSMTRPLPPEIFKSPEEVLAFALEHEKAHISNPQSPDMKQGDYETMINDIALTNFKNTVPLITESGIFKQVKEHKSEPIKPTIPIPPVTNKSIKNHAMNYKMNPSENIYGEDTTTLNLVEDGRRTATTRSFPLGNVGDRITFNNRPQVYVITGVERLLKDNTSNPEWQRQWSEKEGWTQDHFRKVLADPTNKTVKLGSWQTSFVRLPSADQVKQPEISPRIKDAVEQAVTSSSPKIVPPDIVKQFQELGIKHGIPIDAKQAYDLYMGATNVRRLYSDYEKAPRLTNAVPSEVLRDHNLAAKLSLSTDLIIDGEGDNVRPILEAPETPHINPKVVNEMSVITIMPGDAKLTQTGTNLVNSQVKDAMANGATLITDPAILRVGDYWKEFEQLARDMNYEDEAQVGLWIKARVDSEIDNPNFAEYRRDMMLSTMLNNASDITPAKIVYGILKKGMGDKYDEVTLQKKIKAFYLEAERNPNMDLDEWLNKNGIHFKNEEDKFPLVNFITRLTTMKVDGAVIVQLRVTTEVGPDGNDVQKTDVFFRTANAGDLVAGKKIGRLVPLNRAIFSKVQGLDKVSSLPYTTINLVQSGKEIDDIFPFGVEDFHKMVGNKVFAKALEHMLRINDTKLVGADKKALVNTYYYLGGRNDKKELNFMVAHPELLSWSSDKAIAEIARVTGRTTDQIKTLHDKDMKTWFKDMLGFTGKMTEEETAKWTDYYWKARINTLLYLRDFNMSKDFSFINKKGYLRGAGALNKRLQILFNSGASVNRAKFETELLKEFSYRGLNTEEMTSDMNVVFLDVKAALNTKSGTDESIEDGNWYVLPEYFKAIARSVGMPISGGNIKPFSIGMDGYGMMLGKMLVKMPEPELEAWMRENNAHIVADDNGTKQIGDRLKTNLFFDHKAGKVVHAGEVNKYPMTVESFNVVLSEISDLSALAKSPSLTKQFVTNFGWLPKDMRRDILTSFFEQDATGTEESNGFLRTALFNHSVGIDTPKEILEGITNNIDQIGLRELADGLQGKNPDVIRAIVNGIVKKNPESDNDDSLEGERSIDFESVNSPMQDGGASTLIKLGIEYCLYDKFSVRYIQQAVDKYFINRALRPHPGNAVKGVKNRGWLLSKYDVSDEEFMLGSNYKDYKVLYDGIEHRLEDLVTMSKDNTDIADLINHIGIQRVPQDNASGFQILRFKGFIDIDSNEILLHSNVKEATGGSDDDADSYYLWFGGRNELSGTGKGFKMSWLKELKKANTLYKGQKIQEMKVNGKSAKDAVLGATDKAKLELFNDPALMGTPGMQWMASSSTAIARNLLSRVVSTTSVIRMAHSDLSDSDLEKGMEVFTRNGTPYYITARDNISNGERYCAVATTACADPTNFVGIPKFNDALIYSEYFIVKDKNGNEVSLKDRSFGFAMWAHLGQYSKFNSALGKSEGYWLTKQAVSAFTQGGAYNLLGQAKRTLDNLDWNYDFLSRYGDRLNYIYDAMNQSMGVGKGSQGMRDLMEKLYNQITVHDTGDGVKLGKNYANKMAGVPQRKALLALANHLNKIKTYDDLVKYSESDAWREQYIKLVKGTKIEQLEAKFDIETLIANRRVVSEMINQDIIDMTTYLSIRSIYYNNKKFFDTKEGKKVFTDQWNEANNMKSSVSTGDNYEKPKLSMDELNMKVAKYRIGLSRLERDVFDIFMLGSWQKVESSTYKDLENQYKDRDLSPSDYFAKHQKNKLSGVMDEARYKKMRTNLINATNYSQIGVTLTSIPDSAKKAFYGFTDKLFTLTDRITPVEDKSPVMSVSDALESNVKDMSKTKPIEVTEKPVSDDLVFTDPVEDAQLKQRIAEAEQRRINLEKRLEEINNEKSIAQAKSEQLVVKDMTAKQQMLWDQQIAGKTKVDTRSIDLKVLNEQKDLAASLLRNLSFYGIGKDIPLEGIVRQYFHKTTSKMTLNDWRALDKILKNFRTPTLLQRIFGAKEGDQRFIKKWDYFTFNESINKELMRTNMITIPTTVAYLDKDGNLVQGEALMPTHYIGKIQNVIGSILDHATQEQKKLTDDYRDMLSPLTDALGEDGHKIFTLMVYERDLAAARISYEYYSALANGKDGTKKEKDEWAEIANTHKADIAEYKKKLNKHLADNPTTFAKDKKYTVNIDNDFKVLSYEGVKDAQNAIQTSFNERMHKMLTGSEELLKTYSLDATEALAEIAGKHWRIDKAIKKFADGVFYDTLRFRNENEKRLGLNEKLITDIGIDGLTYLGQSEMIKNRILAASKVLSDVELAAFIEKEAAKAKRRPDPHTGMIDYTMYFPQMNEDGAALRARLEPKINAIKNKFNEVFARYKEADESVKAIELPVDEIAKLSEQERYEYDKQMLKLTEIRNAALDEKNLLVSKYMQLNLAIKHGFNGIDDFRLESDDKIFEASIELLSAKETHTKANLDDAIRWEVVTQKVAAQNKRLGGNTTHETTPDVYMDYMNRVVGMLHKKMALIFSKMDVQEALNTKAMGEATDSWVKFIKLYINDSLGNPSVLTKDLIEDPQMKLKGNLYTYLTDSEMSTTLYKLGEKLGIIKPDGQLPDELKHLDYQSIIRFSQLEAQYEMASLLAHPKSYIANLFGGTQLTIVNAGLQNWRDARNPDYIRKNIDVNMKDMREITKTVIESGIVAESFISETGVGGKTVTGNFKDFIDSVQKLWLDNPTFKPQDVRDLAHKYKITESMFDKASWFMRSAELTLRRDAFLAHYIYWYKQFGETFKGSYDKDGRFLFNPILMRLAKQGVKTTQFLYTAPYRPAIARTAFGKILTRFQLWTFNSVATRNEIYQQAKIYGFVEGTEEMKRFERLMSMDMISLALAQAFMFSLFDATLPAPLSWMTDLANWIFGSDKEKEEAFFGAYPGALAPLQVITPPVARLFPATVSGLVSGDWKRLTDYTAWTMFPFGRFARDLQKSYLNPKSFIDRMTGIPFQRFEGPGKDENKTYIPGGIV